MGNCLVTEKKVIKIMRNDGKILEYTQPICVHHILSQFSDHSLFDNITRQNLLPHDANLLSDRLYYLVPTTTMNNKKKKIKKVSFAIPEVREERLSESVVRMKIVVTKQELEKLLRGGSVHEMMYQTLEKQVLVTDDDDLECNRVWRSVLDCIPES